MIEELKEKQSYVPSYRQLNKLFDEIKSLGAEREEDTTWKRYFREKYKLSTSDSDKRLYLSLSKEIGMVGPRNFIHFIESEWKGSVYTRSSQMLGINWMNEPLVSDTNILEFTANSKTYECEIQVLNGEFLTYGVTKWICMIKGPLKSDYWRTVGTKGRSEYKTESYNEIANASYNVNLATTEEGIKLEIHFLDRMLTLNQKFSLGAPLLEYFETAASDIVKEESNRTDLKNFSLIDYE